MVGKRWEVLAQALCGGDSTLVLFSSWKDVSSGFDLSFQLMLNELCSLLPQTQSASPSSSSSPPPRPLGQRGRHEAPRHTQKVCWKMFNLYLTFFFLLLLFFLINVDFTWVSLPPCGVIVWWSFLWTGGQTVVMKLARRVFFFFPLFLFSYSSKTW